MKNRLFTGSSLVRMFVLGILLILFFSMSEKPVLAQQKARYTIKRYREVKEYSKIKTNYIFDKPILKGKSNAIKKINRSLEKEYKKSWDDKETIQDTAKEMSKYSSTRKIRLYTTDKCKVTYNGKGIISFCYYSEWYAGGVNNTYHYGLSYDLKTGRKLQLSDVVSGSKTQIKTKIWKQYNKEYPHGFSSKKGAMKIPLSDWYFYLKNGKVIISHGAYAPWGGNGETKISLQGNYK